MPNRIKHLLLDAKHFSIKKKPFTFYLAFDGETRKPVGWLLLPRYELRAGYDRILNFLERKNCLVEAIISDWHIGLQSAVKDYYPLAIHQQCAAHVLQETYRRLGGRWFLATGLGKEIWPVMRRIALGFDKEIEAGRYLRKARNQYPAYGRAFLVLEKSLVNIYSFSRQPDLAIPRTSNLIENFMGQLNQRLKTFRGIKTPETLIRIITSLILIKYRRSTNF